MLVWEGINLWWSWACLDVRNSTFQTGIKGKYIHQSSRIPVLPSTISEECCVSQWFLIALDEILPSLTKCGITHPVCTQLSLLSVWNWLLRFQLPFSTYLISFYLYERLYNEIKVMNLSPYEVIKSWVTEFQSLIFFFFFIVTCAIFLD